MFSPTEEKKNFGGAAATTRASAPRTPAAYRGNQVQPTPTTATPLAAKPGAMSLATSGVGLASANGVGVLDSSRTYRKPLTPALANAAPAVGLGIRRPDAKTALQRLSPRLRFPFVPVPTAVPLPSERGGGGSGAAFRKKKKEEIVPIEDVEKEKGVRVVNTTPRGQTPIKSGAIAARLAFFNQFEEVVELEC